MTGARALCTFSLQGGCRYSPGCRLHFEAGSSVSGRGGEKASLLLVSDGDGGDHVPRRRSQIVTSRCLEGELHPSISSGAFQVAKGLSLRQAFLHPRPKPVRCRLRLRRPVREAGQVIPMRICTPVSCIHATGGTADIILSHGGGGNHTFLARPSIERIGDRHWLRTRLSGGVRPGKVEDLEEGEEVADTVGLRI